MICRIAHSLMQVERMSRASEVPHALFFSASTNGIGVYASDLAKWVATDAVRGRMETTHILTRAGSFLRLLSARVPGCDAGTDGRRLRCTFGWAARLAADMMATGVLRHCDLVHSMTQSSALAFLLARELGWRGRIVVNIDVTNALEQQEFGWRGPAQRMLVALERFILRSSDAVACWSEWAARSVRLDHGVDSGRIWLTGGLAISKVTHDTRDGDPRRR